MTKEGKGGLREASGGRHKGDDEGGEEAKKLRRKNKGDRGGERVANKGSGMGQQQRVTQVKREKNEHHAKTCSAAIEEKSASSEIL